MVRIGRYESRDAGALADLYRRLVEQIGSKDYAEDQIDAWAALAPSPAQIEARAADDRATLVAVDDEDRPLAFGDLEHDGHIGHLYCASEAAGTGVAAALYDRLEEIHASAV